MILVVVTAARLMRVGHLEGLSFFHARKSSLYFELSVHFLVVLHLILVD